MPMFGSWCHRPWAAVALHAHGRVIPELAAFKLGVPVVGGLFDQAKQILPVAILRQGRRQFLNLRGVNPLLAKGNLFRATDLQALALNDEWVAASLRSSQ